MTIVLTVEGYGIGNFRLRISRAESALYFKKRGAGVNVELSAGVQIKTKTTSGITNNGSHRTRGKGYVLSSPDLSHWIIESKYFSRIDGRSAKLRFEVSQFKDEHKDILLKFLEQTTEAYKIDTMRSGTATSR